jgi:hypothetical protein
MLKIVIQNGNFSETFLHLIILSYHKMEIKLPSKAVVPDSGV